MIIQGCERTSDTTQRLKDFMPFSLKEEKILINVGNSQLNEEFYKDYQIINKTSSIKNAVDKKQMFRLLKKNKIKSVDYIDLSKTSGKIKAIILILLGNKLVFRNSRIKLSNNLKDVFNKDFHYATKVENKAIEYRAIVFNDKIIRMMAKIPYTKSFQLKQENCSFKDIDINKLNEKDKINIINSVKCLGLNLAGVDVLVNDKVEFLILEVNSGASMSPKSCRKLFQEISPINVFNYLDKL